MGIVVVGRCIREIIFGHENLEVIMPRGKKKTTEKLEEFVLPGTDSPKTFTRQECLALFLDCKTFTQDQVAEAIAKMVREETLAETSADRISSVVSAVVSDCFSKIMATRL